MKKNNLLNKLITFYKYSLILTKNNSNINNKFEILVDYYFIKKYYF